MRSYEPRDIHVIDYLSIIIKFKVTFSGYDIA
jgi:hypothetical protein